MRSLLLLGFALVVALTLTVLPGCGRCGQKAAESLTEKAIEHATGGKAKIDVAGSGTVDLSGLPVPLRYPGARAVSATTVSTKDGAGTAYVLETADPVAAVADYYKKAMPDWKESASMQSDDGTVYIAANPDNSEGITVSISRADNKTTIGLMHWRK
uniref:Uncharacterized protein n=1 Tax=candidate division WOR-3 bacterium TaxID=2052148 RepID=A0A7C4GD44_UNCW3